MIIDTHAHLNDEKLLPRADEIHSALKENGLLAVINVGYDRKSSETCVNLAADFHRYYATVGIHPHDSRLARQDDYDRFAVLAQQKKVVAIGEIGLDFYYDLSPRDIQERVFVEQMELAQSLKLPVVIHLRDAYAPMLRLLKENKNKLEYGFLLHCYSGSAEMLYEYARLGGYFSFGGAITFKNATDKPNVIKSAPPDKILVETDCPYMTPTPFRGKTNEPKYVNLVVDRLAEILGQEREEVISVTTNNARTFFKKLTPNEE